MMDGFEAVMEKWRLDEAVLREALESLRPLAEHVRALTEQPGNDLPDAVFDLMAAVFRALDRTAKRSSP